MHVLIQMDHPSTFRPAEDSTMALALEAQKRGYAVSYFTPDQLVYEQGTLSAQVCPILFHDRPRDFYEEGAPETVDLETADVILIRQEPPYDMQYLTACWLLERLDNPLVLNKPEALRRRPEKLFPLAMAQYAPPTLISRDKAAFAAFHHQHRELVLKPLYSYGGRGIFHIREEDHNLGSLLDMMLGASRDPVIAQPFLPQVLTEEKRVLLIDGKIAGAYNRIPAKGEIRANGWAGATQAKTELSPYQREICEVLGILCREEGFFFVGADLIGDWLIEVNTTCPTGIRVVQRLYGTDPAALFWNKVEKKI